MLQGGAGGTGTTTGASGSVVVKSNTTNSTSAFQVQNPAGTTILNVDTTNNLVGTAATNVASTNSQSFALQSGNATGATSTAGNISLTSVLLLQVRHR